MISTAVCRAAVPDAIRPLASQYPDIFHDKEGFSLSELHFVEGMS